MSQPTDLADRYGTAPPWRRGVVIGVSVALAAAFLGWLGWTAWEQSTPTARSELVAFDIVDDHTATATVDVRLTGDDVVATCRLRAYAEDHVVVGEETFTPEDGRNEVEVRTERAATSVELVGCTTPDQSRPR